MSKIKIKLSNRLPVLVDPNEWELIACAEHNDRHGTQIGNEPTREDNWFIKVRQKENRYIVYGEYSYDTAYNPEECITLFAGKIVESPDFVIGTIQYVGLDLVDRLSEIGKEMESQVFHRLIQECISELPAEEI